METTIDLAIKFVSATQGSGSGVFGSSFQGLPMNSTGDFLIFSFIILLITVTGLGFLLLRYIKNLLLILD